MYYLAYGSNLHPLRLSLRVPSARHVGNVTLQGFRLSFDKRSRDGSAKCLFTETGLAEDLLYGAVYRLNPNEKPVLDTIEGLGSGYEEKQISVSVNGSSYDAFLYAASRTHIDSSLVPYDWYKELVILGAAFHRFPDAYIERIAATQTMPDPEFDRVQRIQKLLDSMRLADGR